MKKPTPGPWGALNMPGMLDSLSLAIMGLSSNPDGGKYKIVCSDVRLEDVALISAAPEMLEALKNIENDDGRIPETIWKLRNEAIAKAEGNSNDV